MNKRLLAYVSSESQIEQSDLRNEVQESKDACPSCKSNMDAFTFYLQSFPERSRDFKFLVDPLLVELHTDSKGLLIVLNSKTASVAILAL